MNLAGTSCERPRGTEQKREPSNKLADDKVVTKSGTPVGAGMHNWIRIRWHVRCPFVYPSELFSTCRPPGYVLSPWTVLIYT